MERDEQDRATDGQGDATPRATGFVPSRDVVREIVRAASDVRVILDRWHRHCDLPRYPQDEGVGLALDALFRLERAVNPRRQSWRARLAAQLNISVWPPLVRMGLRWSRDLTADIIERHELQWMAGATPEEFQARLSDPFSLPEIISIKGDELEALDAILEYLPALDSLPEPPEHPVKVAATPREPEATPEEIVCSQAVLCKARGFKSGRYTEAIKKLVASKRLVIRRLHNRAGAEVRFAYLFTEAEERREMKRRVEHVERTGEPWPSLWPSEEKCPAP